MGTWSHIVAGQVSVEEVPNDLDAYYAARPEYTRVTPEAKREELLAQVKAAVKSLKGEDLKAAAEEAGVDPHLKADEQREAIVEARATELTADAPFVTGVTISNAGSGAETDQTQER